MGKKIRLIDANALKGALDRAATAQPRPPYPNAAMSCIDKAPTIDAIPVEWLESKERELMWHEDRFNYRRADSSRADSIRLVILMWQKEQEAR